MQYARSKIEILSKKTRLESEAPHGEGGPCGLKLEAKMANDEQLAILRQGVEAWNKWRDEYYGDLNDRSNTNLIGADFSGADLSKTVLVGADLSRVNLSKANLTEADLTGADLSGASLIEANLNKANLWGPTS